MSNATVLPDDREYMTPAEFAALPSEVHHAVWAAFNANAIDSVPGKNADHSRPQRYNRAQVQAVIRELEAARPAAAAPGKNPGTATQEEALRLSPASAASRGRAPAVPVGGAAGARQTTTA